MSVWAEQNNRLIKEFQFIDFKSAFDFMTKVAAISEAMNHHPYWSNAYNKVRIELNTHDVGGKVTDKDKTLAAAIDQLFNG
ncbi:MAG: 4a-hydroxytetrahydrobiopterin dehydratase [Cytophagaceae bacterium]|jgi:4a-hydroxytetrahydrobiopterin dehydratase|nr:4a-hydroxytetrahydrobiopterin dehydratase [Cytophagaceae bacterium]